MTVGVLVKVDLLQSKRARFTPVLSNLLIQYETLKYLGLGLIPLTPPI